jgi:tetratricopeptide (TPR) repeat protein
MGWLVWSASPDLDSGKELRQAGKLEEAIGVFEDVLSSQPDSLDAGRELAHCLVLAGRYREALEGYEKLGRSQDLRWQWQSAKWSGLTHLYLGEIEAALAEIKRESALARKLGDRAAEVHATWYQGHVLSTLHRFDDATTAFVRALELAPNDLNTLHQAAVLAIQQGDWGSLRYQIPDLEQTVAHAGDADQIRRVYHLQGELAIAQGKPKDAVELLQKANGLFPHPLYQEALARAYRAQGDAKRAEASYRWILEATDERLDIPLYYVMALLGMAEVLDEEGRSEEASRNFQRFLDHWGDAPTSLPGVADAERRLEELRELGEQPAQP